MGGEENIAVGEASHSQGTSASSDALDPVNGVKGWGQQRAPGNQRAAADHYQLSGISEQEVRRQRATKKVRD